MPQRHGRCAAACRSRSQRFRWPVVPALLLAVALGALEAAASDERPATAAMDSAAARGGPPDRLFLDQRPLALRLEGPVREVIRDRSDEPQEHPAVLSWRAEDGSPQRLQIEIRARGNSRRKPENCRFPPIRLDLPKSQTRETLFEKQDKLKLVTHCKGLGRKGVEQRDWVGLEYFVYRILNHVTDYSFRVRAVSMTYVTDDQKEYTHPAFIIEHKDRMAKRLGLALSDRSAVSSAELVPEVTQVMELFQFLVGNTDFSFLRGPSGESCCHNAIHLSDGQRFLPVPYDFDLTGMVNKPVEVAVDGKLRPVTRRQYRGFCRDQRYLEPALALFLEAREAIEAELTHIVDTQQLSRGADRHARQFVDQFYAIITNPGRLQREITARCRD
jgi:hypothetical protein